jgi:WXG100 family type VII secretion target
MGTPQSYDTAQIKVSPQSLSDVSAHVNNLIQDVVNQLDDINNTLSSLQLSWMGPSADLAAQFNQQWQDAATSLFGTQQDPNEGALIRLAEGLQAASQNYDNAEQWAVESFNKLATNLSGGGSSSSAPPTSVTNSGGTVVTAITETF